MMIYFKNGIMQDSSFMIQKTVMKKNLMLLFLLLTIMICRAQEVLRIKNGATITIQDGAALTLQGGITLENGSALINSGSLLLKNNSVANSSDWLDNSAVGALSGNGWVIFNSTQAHNFWGHSNFYNLQLNAGGLTINNNLSISNFLNLINGKINTGANYVFLNNNDASSLLNDVSNVGYTNSWVNGKFRRLITSNTSSYDFPVGNTMRCNLLQFINNKIAGTNYLSASFGPKPGTDAGLNVSENSVAYTAINNGGAWYLTPDAEPSGGNYALQLYFNGFTGLSDNLFGILRRPDVSTNASDWTVPSGSSLEPLNGLGRKLSDGFARRINLSDFSQLGIGMMGSIPCENCPAACTYSQGFYGNINGTACYNNSGTTISSTQLMLNAFGATSFQVFGNVANKRFFTLYKTDISKGSIFKMLPGSGNSQAIAVDNVFPYDGAYYDDPKTWSLVPIQPNGPQKGRINNLLLSQIISLWFNLNTSSSLGTIDLSMDTLVTTAQTTCGSRILIGNPVKFGLQHSVVLYLNGGNGYSNNVNGLFQLANDVLGGVNTSVSAADVQSAVAVINIAFEGCRILTGTIAYGHVDLITRMQKLTTPEIQSEKLLVTAFPNPYNDQFSLRVNSPVSGMAMIEFFTVNGTKVFELRKFVADKIIDLVPYTGPRHSGALMYKVTIGNYRASGFVIGIN